MVEKKKKNRQLPGVETPFEEVYQFDEALDASGVIPVSRLLFIPKESALVLQSKLQDVQSVKNQTS